MTGKKILYMDKVDFDFELGEAEGGNTVFSSEEDLLKHQPCAKECGIVKVSVELLEVVNEGNFGKKVRSNNLIGEMKEINGRLEFVSDENQPNPKKYIRIFGTIKSENSDEIAKFCKKHGIKYDFFHSR